MTEKQKDRTTVYLPIKDRDEAKAKLEKRDMTLSGFVRACIRHLLGKGPSPFT